MSNQPDRTRPDGATEADHPPQDEQAKSPVAKEIGGPKEADPTRYGDWTVKGRCIDF